MTHDAFGWWVREAGAPAELAPLREDIRADVVVVGGGYLGMWTAWHLLEREPGAEIALLEAHRCGFGPSGRNGGFVNGYWDKLGAMAERFGADAALRLGRAAEQAVHAIGAFCESEGVDAWFRPAPHLEVATNAAQEGAWAEAVAGFRAAGGGEGDFEELTAAEVAQHARSPCFRGGTTMPTAATVQPARLAFGLRERLLARGVRIFERSRVTRIADGIGGVRVACDGGAVLADAAVVAVNHAAGALRPFRGMVSTASSHIALTAPAPDALERIGWTDGSALSDYRTMLHYTRTTPDGRVAFGWGGGRMGYAARRREVLDVDPRAVAGAERALGRLFPELSGVPVEAAWGGPIDVSPIRLPQYRQVGRTVAGFGFTGNGVGPSHLGGQVLSGMALDRRDESTALPLVEPAVRRFPPEPLRFLGASLIRAALVRSDADADEGRTSPAPVRFLAGLPKRLGMSLPR